MTFVIDCICKSYSFNFGSPITKVSFVTAILLFLSSCQTFQDSLEASRQSAKQTDIEANARFGNKQVAECDAKLAGGTRLGPYSLVRGRAKDKVILGRTSFLRGVKDVTKMVAFVAPYRTTGILGKGVTGLGCVYENLPNGLRLIDRFRGTTLGVTFKFEGIE